MPPVEPDACYSRSAERSEPPDALHHDVHVPRTRPEIRKTSAHLRSLATFDGVGQLTGADLDEPTLIMGLNSHFADVERLARIVLDGSSVTDQSGRTAVGSVLVNMATLFERFVENRVRAGLEGRLVVHGQFRTTLDTASSVAIRPDLVFSQNGKPVYVADAKYKLTGDGYGREADYYQLLAYCSSLGLDEGLLIYCQHEGSVPSQEVTVRCNFGVRLHTVALQLSGSPSELDARCSDLAEQIAVRLSRQFINDLAYATPQLT